MTIGTTAVAAGWYKDPAGTSALRWWDGTKWTDQLQQTAPVVPQPPVPPVQQAPMQQQPSFQAVPPVYSPNPQFTPTQVAPTPPAPAQPELSLSSYSPVTGYSQSPRDPSYNNDPYSGRASFTKLPVRNTIAWISFGAGLVSIAVIILIFMFPGNYYVPVFGLTAIVSGIRAIIAHRRGTVSVLWAPIVGIVLGVITELVVIGSLILVHVAPPVVPVTLGPVGATTNYDMGVGTPQFLPTGNTDLAQAAMDENRIVGVLQTDFTNGSSGSAADGDWPAGLVHSSTGDVQTTTGRDLGTLIGSGWHLAYQVQPDGSILIEVSGSNTSEVAVYSSESNEYLAWCESSDTTCKTNSTVPPYSDNTTTQGATNT